MTTTTKMSEQDHKERHVKLHQGFDELLADFIGHTEGLPSKATVMELLEWSYQQTINPTPPRG